MRLIDVLKRSTAFLEQRGVESPRRQVEWILAGTLRVPRLQLYLEFERMLEGAHLDAIRAAVLRRGRREPLQHVLGTAVFCGIELECGPAALVPRPETELLAEKAWIWLRARPADRPPPGVLDWGTGTGCLAIAIAKQVPGAEVRGLEGSPEAAELARRNVERHSLTGRVTILEGDGCAALDGDARFDLIVSNPPYIPTAEIAGLEPEVRDHDPKVALDGGADGLDVYRRLAVELEPRLLPGGALMLEFGDGQAGELRRILGAAGWVVAEVLADYSGRERLMVARRA